jgi:hypothetical protein
LQIICGRRNWPSNPGRALYSTSQSGQFAVPDSQTDAGGVIDFSTKAIVVVGIAVESVYGENVKDEWLRDGVNNVAWSRKRWVVESPNLAGHVLEISCLTSDPYSGTWEPYINCPASPTTTAEEWNILGTRLLAFPMHKPVLLLNTNFSTAQDGAGTTHLCRRYSALRFVKLSDCVGVPAWTNRIATGGVGEPIEEGHCLWPRWGCGRVDTSRRRCTGL